MYYHQTTNTLVTIESQFQFYLFPKLNCTISLKTNVQQTLLKRTLLRWIIILFHFSWFLTGLEKSIRRYPKSIRFQNIKNKGHKLSSTFSKCRKIYFQIQYFSITNMISLQTLLHLFKQTNKIKITYSSLQPSDSKKSRKHPNVYSQHILYGVALQLQLQRHNLHPRKSSWKFLQRPPKIVLIKTLFYILLINKYKLSNNQ